METSSNGEIFLDEAGWKEEATAVINDVKDCVKTMEIADKLESSASNIFLNLTIKEGTRFTVELTCQGFRVSGHDHNTCNIQPPSEDSQEEEVYFETPYALLNKISPGFREAFGNSLVKQLEKVAAEQKKEEEEKK